MFPKQVGLCRMEMGNVMGFKGINIRTIGLNEVLLYIWRTKLRFQSTIKNKLYLFTLDKFYPTNYIQTLGSGTNKPILTRAMDVGGIREDIVIKLMDSERMNTNAALKELVGSFIALELNLNTPTPCLAEVTPDFAETQFGRDEYQRLRNSIGINFASKNITGLELFGPYDNIAISQRTAALKIFYFDLMIQNPDRTVVHGKPNLFTKGLDLWILDHEIAFSFLVPIIGRPKTNSWEFSDFDLNMIQHHVLYKSLKGKKMDFSVLEHYLDGLNEDFWVNLSKIIPEEWMGSDFWKIKGHVTSIKEHQGIFSNQVKTFLS